MAAPALLATPTLRLEGVSLEYATGHSVVRATHRVSLDVFESERYVLLGPSGCGKSTLLKAAAGFVRPREGRVLLDSVPVQGPGPDRMVVFQEFDQLPPWKTVRDNVLFPLLATKRLPRRAAELRTRDVLQQVGLLEFAGHYPHQLSGGMKQRVAIARALAMQPRVLLMDEPFAALDALTRRRMQEELLALWAEVRFTLLFVTHSIEEALIVGSRVGVLTPRPGRLRAELDAQDFGFASSGGVAFQAATQRLHGWLVDASGCESGTEAGDAAGPESGAGPAPSGRHPLGHPVDNQVAA
jgi:NitT/TauT family transport system ATP-binding protein